MQADKELTIDLDWERGWDQGTAAFEVGKPKEACPYPPRSTAGEAWLMAYEEAQEHIKAARAYEQGFDAAVDDSWQVIPYAARSRQAEAWLDGYWTGSPIDGTVH